MAEERAQRRLAAILAADVVGYTRLMEVDESDAFARLKAHRKELFEPEIGKHNGRIFKLMGDGLLAEFGSVVDAVECAIVLQREMAARNESVPNDRRIDTRIGVTLGDVIVDGEDRYGEGVNVAARLEQLADPGGIAISGAAYDQLQGKVDLPFEFKGEQQVKNISRPVRIYRMNTAGGAKTAPLPATRPRTPWASLAAAALLALCLVGGALWWFRPAPPPASAKAAVAVLPFNNYSGDEETSRLADGLTEDIITDLTRFAEIDVIARNSTEVYTGKPTDIRQIADALRVGYVLEGSIQHQGGRVRITAQLIDATSNSHLWSQRWDRPDEDLFAVQSEIAEQVTDELGRDTGSILKAERDSARRKPPASLSAYESYLLGNEKLAHPDPANLQEAVRLFKHAAELDPHMTRAWSGISFAYNIISYSGADFDKWHQLASDAAERAVSLDPDDAEAHAALAAVLVSAGNIIRAKSEAETALRLAPGSAAILTLYAGWAATLGEAEHGGEAADHAIRLDPNYPPWSVPSFAYGYFAADRYDDSLRVLERLPTDDYTPDMWVVRPGALAATGRLDEAKSWVKEALKRFPDLTAEGWANSPGYANDERQRFLKMMKLAGFPPCAKPEALSRIANSVRLPECANAQGAPN